MSLSVPFPCPGSLNIAVTAALLLRQTNHARYQHACPSPTSIIQHFSQASCCTVRSASPNSRDLCLPCSAPSTLYDPAPTHSCSMPISSNPPSHHNQPAAHLPSGEGTHRQGIVPILRPTLHVTKSGKGRGGGGGGGGRTDREGGREGEGEGEGEGDPNLTAAAASERAGERERERVEPCA